MNHDLKLLLFTDDYSDFIRSMTNLCQLLIGHALFVHYLWGATGLAEKEACILKANWLILLWNHVVPIILFKIVA